MVCFLVFNFFFSSVLFSQQSKSDSTILKIDNLIASGNYQKALTIIDDVLFKDPVNIEIQEKKINILSQIERSKDALNDVEEFISLYPSQPLFYYLRALLNLQKQKYTRAVEDFDRALLLNMAQNVIYKIYLNRGMAHFYLQDFDLAEADFNKVIEQDSRNAAAYHGMGMVKYELRQYDEAVTEFQKALKIEDNNPITHFNMAMTYFRLDDKDNACYHFNRSCALGNRNACRLLMMECAQELKIAK
jgi:tetratricopeptide (TPR) repeat protein